MAEVAGTLHQVSRAPAEGEAAALCARHARAGDAVILIENAVVLALADANAATNSWPADVIVHVLRADLLARGLAAAPLRAIAIDDDAWVALTERHARVVSWY